MGVIGRLSGTGILKVGDQQEPVNYSLIVTDQNGVRQCNGDTAGGGGLIVALRNSFVKCIIRLIYGALAASSACGVLSQAGSPDASCLLGGAAHRSAVRPDISVRTICMGMSTPSVYGHCLSLNFSALSQFEFFR